MVGMKSEKVLKEAYSEVDSMAKCWERTFIENPTPEALCVNMDLLNRAETKYLNECHRENARMINRIEVNWNSPENLAAEARRICMLEMVKSLCSRNHLLFSSKNVK